MSTQSTSVTPGVKDLAGRVFGTLTVHSWAGRDARGRPTWNCECACTGKSVVRSDLLLAGNTQSCGRCQFNLPSERFREWLKTKLLSAVSITENGCWEWSRRRDLEGYGRLNVRGVRSTAHAESYKVHHGDIPTGLCVLHRCDNPPCINPDHLFLGTPEDNNADKFNKGRQAKGERVNTAKLTTVDVLQILRLYAMGHDSIGDLACRFGVCTDSIRNIIRGKTWKHVSRTALLPEAVLL